MLINNLVLNKKIKQLFTFISDMSTLSFFRVLNGIFFFILITI